MPMAPTSFQTYDVPPPGFDLRALTIDVSDNAYGDAPGGRDVHAGQSLGADRAAG